MLNDLSGYTMRAEFTNDGYPEECSIMRAEDNGVTICEVGGGGTPIINSTWLVQYDEIISFTVL